MCPSRRFADGHSHDPPDVMPSCGSPSCNALGAHRAHGERHACRRQVAPYLDGLSQFCYSRAVSWLVVYHPAAEAERGDLPATERAAIDHAVEKLRAGGPILPHPHSSDVKIAVNLRELRPRAGRCRYRAFYRRIGDAFVIGAIGPEAEVNQRGFRRAVTTAEERLDAVKGEE
jgi:hypothetical protein